MRRHYNVPIGMGGIGIGNIIMYRNEGRKGRGKEEGDIIMPNIIMSREHACGGHNNEATWTALLPAIAFAVS